MLVECARKDHVPDMVDPKVKKARRDRARSRLSNQRKGRFRKHIRGYFLAGVLVTAPIGITFYISWLLIRWVDSKITPLIPEKAIGTPNLDKLLMTTEEELEMKENIQLLWVMNCYKM